MPTQISSLDTAPPFDDYYLFHPSSTSQTQPWQYENTESDQALENGGNMNFGISEFVIPSGPKNDRTQRTTSSSTISTLQQSGFSWDQVQQSWPSHTGLTPEPPGNFTAPSQLFRSDDTARDTQFSNVPYPNGAGTMSPISKFNLQDIRPTGYSAPQNTPRSSRKRNIDDTVPTQSKRSKKDGTAPQGFKSRSEVQSFVKLLNDSINTPKDIKTFHNYSRSEAQQRILHSAGTVRLHKLRANSGDFNMVDDVLITSLSEELYKALLCPPAGAWPEWDADVREHFNKKEQSQLKIIKDKLEHRQYQLTVSARVKELLYLTRDLHIKGIPMSSIVNLEDFDEDMIENDELHLSKKPIKVKGGYLLEEALPFLTRVHAMIKACSNKHVAKDLVFAEFEDLHGLIWAPEGYEKRKYNNGRNNSAKAIKKRKGKAAVEQLKAYNDALTQFTIDEMLASMPSQDGNHESTESSSF